MQSSAVMDLAEFVRRTDVEQSVLLLGAGASVPCGGQTGVELARDLCDTLSSGQIESDELAEAASLLEERYGRQALVEALSVKLEPLRPDGPTISLVSLPWQRIYTTNFDQVIERACQEAERSFEVIRSNRDFTKLDSGRLEVLKIHGCITRDRALGHRDSMVLTESDYQEFDNQREALFAKLLFELHTKDVLIIGQSLKDRHLRDLIDEVAKRAKRQNTSNRIRTLIYSSDPARLRLISERGLEAASGSIAAFIDAVMRSGKSSEASKPRSARGTLPNLLLPRTEKIANSINKPADAPRMFNGSSASWADIESGYTFARTIENLHADALEKGDYTYLTILGAGGVGKTTAARRILYRLHKAGFDVYEHVTEFPFTHEPWLEVASSAKAGNRPVFLLVDEASKHLSGLNRLVAELDRESNSYLRIVCTAHLSAWTQRAVSGLLRKSGREETLKILQKQDVRNLVDLIRTQSDIGKLVDPQFAGMSRSNQINAVHTQCEADMFVALKYCFPGDGIDEIILKEYRDLSEDVQEVYKVAALLGATYAMPSRQLILDVVGYSWEEIPVILKQSRGVLTERLVNAKEGIYTWSTRHPIISQVLVRFKYTDQDELYYAYRRIVATLNSAMLLDRNIIPSICNNDYGIGRIKDAYKRIELYELLCEKTSLGAPWHKLISNWMDLDLDKASLAIRRAENTIGIDSPIQRYKVRLNLVRSAQYRRLGTDDYIALILEAEDVAREGLEKWPDNKYSYLSLVDVGKALHEATRSTRILEDCVPLLDRAYTDLLDNDILRYKRLAERAIAD